ncbi:hypothetical protein BKA67DRAFT_286983 [Truncatella angustata]|uniref:Microbial-type PARG catalytic domain-containing protein n=1 Tax=Truncatella angustata TaxID=152316 RepID=A0A9P8UMA4_9PEZI|nr:uncharacterized protein BKA67DRAFT_286983 [Truncatella angustata]KAH6654676.1 hypothetical protein BKA67DRAFT_286983 [Truncatella angustata]KAH8196944.1 hypothetical protein TruAng_008901 [Truncatella angustata]
MPSSRPKPSDVAAETKKNEIPEIRAKYSQIWPCHSYLFQSPAQELVLDPRTNQSLPAPIFSVHHADPVDFTINWERDSGCRIPLICAANDRRPGGDWETGVVGYEERFCRRSNLSACLATPGPGSSVGSNYPIPSEGGIYSEFVVVFRGPHDTYKKLPQWVDLPVVSIPPARWPKLSQGGLKYAFPLERQMVMNKIRAGLLICAAYGHKQVVIMDFSLGNSNRNPPQELAELWREVFLWDPDLRGRFQYVAFVFEDPYQSTTKHILDDITKKSKSGGSGSKKSKSSNSSGSSSSYSTPNDHDIFCSVFAPNEIQRVISRTDPRCSLSTLTS